MVKKTKQKSPEALSPLADTNKQVFAYKALEDWFAGITNEIQTETMRNQTSKSSQVATQMLSRFGLKNPRDLVLFLRSPAGKTLQGLINKKLEALKARQLHAADNQLEKQRLRGLAMLLLGLAYKKDAKAEERIQHFNERLVQKQLDAGEQAIEANQKQYEEASREASEEAYHASLEESAALYDESSNALEEVLNEYTDELEDLENDQKSVEEAEANQETRAGYFDSLIDNIESFFDLDSEEQEQLTENNPELMNRFPKDKTIVKEEGKAYLLERGQKLDALSSEEKANAHTEYKKLEPHLSDLKKTVKTSHEKEQAQHATRKARCVTQSVRLHQEIIHLTQKLAQLQTVLHETQNDLETNRLKLQPKLTPQQTKQAEPEEPVHKKQQTEPTPQAKKPSPRPEPQPPNTGVLTRSFELMLRLDPRATIAAQDRLGAPRLLQQTEFGMPIERQTMQSLQRHRAGRAGALANAIAVSAVAEVSHRAHERLHPDAEPQVTPKAQVAPKAEPEAENTAPSPFSMRLKPGE